MNFLEFYYVCACMVTDVECCSNENTDVKEQVVVGQYEHDHDGA